MPDVKVKLAAAGRTLKAPRVASRFSKPITLASLFLLALATRTYKLDEMPYFPEGFPWLGGNPEGLYLDEVTYLKISQNLFDRLSLYQPPFFLLFMNLSVKAFGSPYAVRLPPAIASSFVAVLIYLVSMRKFKSCSASILSSLYFIAMTPAFIYNRMAFLENGVALFLLASYYCLLLYDECGRGRWLYLSGAFAALSTLTKINGLVAPLFLMAYSLHKAFLTKAFKPIVLAFSPFVFPLAVLPILGSWRMWLIGYVGRESSAWQFLIINTMPSGYLTEFLGYLRPEYWYIFAYFALAYIAVKEYEKVSDVILMITSFIGLCLLIWGISSYYLIVLQPFLAIPVGYALKKMLRMQPHVATLFILFIYAPMVITFNIAYFGEGPYPRYDLIIYALKILTVGAPLATATWLFIRGKKVSETWRMLFNGAVLSLFLVLLFVGSYLAPVFYPHYFNIKG